MGLFPLAGALSLRLAIDSAPRPAVRCPAMATWRLAYSLETLRDQVNAAWPNRDRSSDGAIGDAAHAATPSDHNPNAAGVVCAYDIDTDLDGTDDSSSTAMDLLVERIRLAPHPDIKYLIYRGRMFSAYARDPYPPFVWRPYTGADPHTSHAHVSVGVGRDGQSVQPYDDRIPWAVPDTGDDDPMTDAQIKAVVDPIVGAILGERAQLAEELSDIRNELNEANGVKALLTQNLAVLNRIATKIGA